MRLRLLLSFIGLCLLLPVSSQAASLTKVNVRIESSNEVLTETLTTYVNSAGCTVTDSAETEHSIEGAKAICALTSALAMAELDYSFDYYDGLGLFVNTIGDYATPSDYSEYWSFFVNYESASVGVADYTVAENDEVLLYFGPYTAEALRLQMPDNEIMTGDKLVLRVQQLTEADQNTFAPVAGASVVLNDTVTVVTDAFGKASFRPSGQRDTITVYATKDGVVRSQTVTVKVVTEHDKVQPFNQSERQQLADAGITVLKESIGKDDLILDSQSLTEWSAMAFAAAGQSAGRLRTPVLAYEPTVSAGTNELARHILALVALGYDPTDTNGIDYLARLEKTQSGKQFGSTAYVNDDIFAGLAFLAAGRAGDSANVTTALRAAKAGSNSDGGVSFTVDQLTSDVDTTAFFIQFLEAADAAGSTLPLKAAQAAAMDYLLNQQNLDGGFGYSDLATSNAPSTAVVLQAWQAVGRNPNDISRNKRTAFNYLASVQKDSGQFRYSATIGSSYDALNTAYAIIGLYDQALPILP